MKDRQFPPPRQDTGIPLLSPVLHIAAMSVIVYFRRRFGFSFLRPLGIFFALTWAVGFFTAYAWMTRQQNGVWTHYGALCVFFFVAFVLFLAHRLFATGREFVSTGRHDYHSGDSWTLFFLPAGDRTTRELIAHLAIEPILTAAVALLLYTLEATRALAVWLFIAAAALALKELINHWDALRKIKRGKDALADTEEVIGQTAPQEAPGALRSQAHPKPNPVPFTPTVAVEDPSQIWRCARVLGMEPPYSLEKATRLYRAKIKVIHPDSADSDHPPENASAEVTELTEALNFFRKKYP